MMRSVTEVLPATYPIAVMLLLATPPHVLAAEIIYDSGGKCAITLNGEIVEGDFDSIEQLSSKLQLKVGQNDSETVNTLEEALCLDSPGGSYFEGRKIAQFVHENSIPTRVLAAKSCLSACALIFMAGRVSGDEMDFTSRTLDVHGKLGFHAPYWTFPAGKTFTASELSDITILQHLLVADFIKFGSYSGLFSYRNSVSTSLLAALYSASPGEFVFADTTEKVARWGIDLDGIDFSTRLKRQASIQLCENFRAWSLDKKSETTTAEYASSVSVTRDIYQIDENAKPFVVYELGGMESVKCAIEDTKETKRFFEVCLSDGFNGLSLGDCKSGYGFDVPSYFALPPDTPIITIAKD